MSIKEFPWDENGNARDLNELGKIIDTVCHEAQPHTILGIRGQQEIKLKDIQICECFMRGFLLGATDYGHLGSPTEQALPVERLGYHQLYDLLYSKNVNWIKDFDPVAVVQCGSCQMEKVLGIYPNVQPLKEVGDGKE